MLVPLGTCTRPEPVRRSPFISAGVASGSETVLLLIRVPWLVKQDISSLFSIFSGTSFGIVSVAPSETVRRIVTIASLLDTVPTTKLPGS